MTKSISAVSAFAVLATCTALVLSNAGCGSNPVTSQADMTKAVPGADATVLADFSAPGDMSMPPDEASMCGGNLGLSAECETCIETNCCAQMVTCFQTPDCPELFMCLHACPQGDGNCDIVCLKGPHGGAAGPSSAVDGCIFMKCPMGCRE